MKNLIYILIFIPSLLFSQETKNMELVGVRNIPITLNQNYETIEFFVDTGNVFKILNISFGVSNSDGNIQSLNGAGTNIRVSLDGGLIYENDYNQDLLTGHTFVDYPFYLNEGWHNINAHCQYYSYPSNIFSVNIYGLEFKLTTP